MKRTIHPVATKHNRSGTFKGFAALWTAENVAALFDGGQGGNILSRM
jgi:hypothetical protein